MEAKRSLTSAALGLPQRLGRFEILRQLGQGSQSVVYLGFDLQLQREVAIKALRGPGTSAEMLLNEARAVSKLSHPGIVPIFDVGEAPSGPYLVFEYVPGPTLADVLQDQGPLATELAVQMLLPALDAVAYAHAAGVIHRDLKPSNILLDRRGGARVMDFGIAVRQADSAAAPAQGTDAAQDDIDSTALMGTPAYMAPEYAVDGRISAQMDVFSAGLILYEMLTGKRAVPPGAGHQVLLYLVHQDVRLPAQLPHRVDESVRAIVHRAVARDCALRYPEMGALAQDLRDWRKRVRTAPAQAVAAPPQPPSATVPTPGTGLVPPVRPVEDRLPMLLGRIQAAPDTPLLPGTVVRLMVLAPQDPDSLAALGRATLGDVALSHKLLRTVNAALRRSGMGQGRVSTVSAAIRLMGFNAVRTVAAGVPGLMAWREPAHRARVLDCSLLALWAGHLAQQLSALPGDDAEEAFLCASARHLGPMLVCHCFPLEADAIDLLAPLGGVFPWGRSDVPAVYAEHREQAARHVLGLGFGPLAAGIAGLWDWPPILLHGVADQDKHLGRQRPAEAIEPVSTRAGLLQLLGSFALELSYIWLQPGSQREVVDTEALVQRYGKALGLTMPRVQVAVQSASDEVRQQLQAQPQHVRQDLNHSLLAHRLGLAPRPNTPRSGVPSQTLAQPGTTDTALAQAIQRVAAAVQDSGMNLNQLLHEVLAAVVQGTGFERVIFVFKDRGSSAMHGRFSVGPRTQPLPEVFRLTLDDGTDGFAEVVRQGHDLWVPEAKADVMRPVWHLQAFDAGCYLLLPLRLKGQAFGLIYAEHAQPQGVFLTAKALSQLGTLRDQTVMAFKRHTA